VTVWGDGEVWCELELCSPLRIPRGFLQLLDAQRGQFQHPWMSPNPPISRTFCLGTWGGPVTFCQSSPFRITRASNLSDILSGAMGRSGDSLGRWGGLVRA
jgi:hypothetical protein